MSSGELYLSEESLFFKLLVFGQRSGVVDFALLVTLDLRNINDNVNPSTFESFNFSNRPFSFFL